MARTLTDEDIEAIATRVVTRLATRLGTESPSARGAGTDAALPPENLAFTHKELMSALGLSSSTLWRLEQRGYLKTVPGVRHKIYARREVERFLGGRDKPSWGAR